MKFISMAGGRRNINRSGAKQHTVYSSDDSKSSSKSPDNGPKPASPKHMPMPSLPQDSSITFELIMFMYTAAAVFLQFLHLYRTVWWHPQSHTSQAMNFYLIDPYLIGFILTILVRRLVYSILSYMVILWAPSPLWTLLEQLIRLFLFGVVMMCLLWSVFHCWKNQPYSNIFYLCYPISVYFIVFGLNISPFFDVSSFPSIHQDDCEKNFLGRPVHSCSQNPHNIRNEVEDLRHDFNSRMRQILFSSMLNAYYAGFIPCTFASHYLYYDIFWATQHLAFTWLGCLTMYFVHCYPVSYCDTLHQAALHLGKWIKVEGRASHLPSQPWADTTLWQQGALVKYCKEIYKAEGITNAAEPGNSNHIRFYSLFYNPSLILCSLASLQLSLVMLQLIILTRTSEWYKVLSISLLLFANHYPLFKLSRDYLICWKVYKAEALIQDKANGG